MKSKKISRTLTLSLLKAVQSFYLIKIFIGEYVSVFQKRKIYKDVILSAEEKADIQEVWEKNYNKKISTRWHRLYQSYTGKFNKLYFPEVLFTIKLEKKLNDREISRVISDKSLLPLYYKDIKGVRMPDSYLINNSGIFYNSEREIISREDAVFMLKNIGEAVIKPTLDSSSGDSVIFCDFQSGIDVRSNNSLDAILNSYNENYIVQEKITQSSKLSDLYPDGVNTLRVITFLAEDRIKHAPITLSMGRSGSRVDNIQAGGIAVAVSDKGVLRDEGYTHYKEIHKFHPDTGTLFKNHQLPRIGDLIKVVKVMHEKTPHMRMISWDFTLDDKDNIVLLEINLSGQSVWFPQMVSGEAVFGENTEEMIRMIQK